MSAHVRAVVSCRMSRLASLVTLLVGTWGAPAAGQPVPGAPKPATAPPQTAGRPPAAPASIIAVSKFDPAEYVRIYEEEGPNRRLLLFDSTTQSTLFRVDADSKIVVELARLTPDMALNGVFMSAELSRLATDAGSANVEVLNYSEIAQDPKTQASQAGVALRTASDVKTVLLNLYSTTKDAIAAAYQPECVATLEGAGRPQGCITYTLQPGANDRLRTVLSASQERITAIADFFTSDRNGLVLSVIGARVFDLDARSLTAVAARFRDDVAKFVAGGADGDKVAPGLHLNLQRLWDDMQPLRVAYGKTSEYFEDEWRKNVFPRFMAAVSPGVIDLRRYKATDGETLKLTVQSRAAGGEGAGGVSRDFHFAVKKLKPRVTTEPSAYYVRRQGEIRNDKGEIVSQKFTPAPGVTFGAVFYGRSRLLSILAPGIGANVSFMNFGTGDFDPAIKDAAGNTVGGFSAASGGSLQVGVGVAASVFSNAVQFTFGKNLQVDGERPWYAGIDFGFVQVAQELAKLGKK